MEEKWSLAGAYKARKTTCRPGLCLALLLCLTAILAASCQAKALGAVAGPTRPNPQLPTLVLSSGPASITVEVATTDDQRERGLMFRTKLAEGKGMLFVFEADQVLAFWMKNTTLTLSVAYISSDGTIREIHDLEPLSLAAVTSSRSVRFALEAPRGWFERAGLGVGSRFVIPDLH